MNRESVENTHAKEMDFRDVDAVLSTAQRPQPSVAQIEAEQIFSMTLATLAGGAVFPFILSCLIAGYFVIAQLVVLFRGEALTEITTLVAGFMGLLMFTAIGACLCGFTATIVGFCTAVFVNALHAATNRAIHPKIMCQVVGGLTGYICLMFIPYNMLSTSYTPAKNELLAMTGLIALAMTVGHYAATRTYKNLHANYRREKHFGQFGILHILATTTLVAGLTALLTSFRNGLALAFFGITFQFVLLAATEAFRYLRAWVKRIRQGRQHSPLTPKG